MESLKTSFEDLMSLSLLSSKSLSAQTIADLCYRVNDLFWSDTFWLPDGVTWEDVSPSKGYPNARDITTYPFVIAAVLLVLKKFFVIPFILSPLARHFGLRDRRRSQPERVPTLEILYRQHGKVLPPTMVEKVSRNLNWTTKQVENWLRRRDMSQKSSVYEKFVSVGFLAVYHICFTIFGVVMLYDEPFVWNAELCFEDFPFQELSSEIWWYYMIGLGYFWSLVFSLLFEGRTKEYLIDCIHHAVTIMLMSFSWVNNFVRIGSLVLLLHSFSDALLFPGKMFVYSKHEKVTTAFFAVFVIVWMVTRIILFPFHVLKNVMTLGYISQSLCVYDVLLSGLLLLNIRWTALILRMIFKKLCQGELVDETDDNENSADEFDEYEKSTVEIDEYRKNSFELDEREKNTEDEAFERCDKKKS
ncbi:ceramide synthase 2 [Hyalella azteca]|uniref:Ceramide synthase 2 n=1 Tax=Hyalella azteca TaxID=294128 RepID=A0A8B7PD79_HYAAZ|nr:ceramide synthase 2 [Hyalella azteca]